MEKKKNSKSKKTIYTVLMLVCLVVFLFALYNIVSIMTEYDEIEEYYEGTEDEFVVMEEGMLSFIDFAKIRAINDDVIAWIYMPDTNISYPVLQGSDNDYYLYRNYEKQYLGAGSIFVDAANSGDFTDQHTIVYGHNMHNGSMFGALDKFKSKEYKDEHPDIYMLFPDGTWNKYEIYAYYTADIDDGTFEIFLDSKTAYDKYIKLTTSKSVYKDTQGPAAGEKILTLSTCTEDSDDFKRNVIQARYVGVVEGIK